MNVTMIGRLSECFLLAYRTRPETVERLLPPGLALALHEGDAFWNIVVSKVEKMRPAGAPRALGMSYVHVAYRLYVEALAQDGERLEGLFFVRSDVDRALMALGGNLATDFRFHASDVSWRSEASTLDVEVRGDAPARLRLDLAPGSDAPMPPPFLKYQPLGLSTNRRGTRLRLAQVERNEARWRETPVRVVDARWGLFEQLGQQDASLVAATQVAPLDYRWRIGATRRLAAR